MRHTLLTAASLLLIMAGGCRKNAVETESHGNYILVRQTCGPTLGYSPESGVSILEIDGYAFKDLNRNGELGTDEENWQKCKIAAPPDQVRTENDNYRKKLFVHRCLTAIAIIFGISVLFVRKKRRDDSRTVQEKAVFNDRDEIVCENPDPDKTFLKALEMHIRQAMKSGKVDLEDIASKMCISRTHLNRKVKSITGETTSEFVLGIRISTAKELLLTTGLPVWEVSARCGIEDPTYFSTLFKKSVGKTPAQFRNENHTVHS